MRKGAIERWAGTFDKPTGTSGGAGFYGQYPPRGRLASIPDPGHIRRMAKPLSSAKITAALAELPGWASKRDALTKEFKFGSFREAMAFMVRVSYEAEALNHHPDWTNVYNRVLIRLNTHDADGKVTTKDVELAKKIQAMSWVG
jgi:4a-hydroxytetrahydrobiopterin dehydratase